MIENGVPSPGLSWMQFRVFHSHVPIGFRAYQASDDILDNKEKALSQPVVDFGSVFQHPSFA